VYSPDALFALFEHDLWPPTAMVMCPQILPPGSLCTHAVFSRVKVMFPGDAQDFGLKNYSS
jgi:hypothetical protein